MPPSPPPPPVAVVKITSVTVMLALRTAIAIEAPPAAPPAQTAPPQPPAPLIAQLRFKNVGGSGITTNNCRTGDFTSVIQGDWGAVDSDPLTFPALSGSGTGACNTWASTINNFFDLGTSGATVTLYKFEGIEDATGLPLDGS